MGALEQELLDIEGGEEEADGYDNEENYEELDEEEEEGYEESSDSEYDSD
jgi:hypothetical protein